MIKGGGGGKFEFGCFLWGGGGGEVMLLWGRLGGGSSVWGGGLDYEQHCACIVQMSELFTANENGTQVHIIIWDPEYSFAGI